MDWFGERLSGIGLGLVGVGLNDRFDCSVGWLVGWLVGWVGGWVGEWMNGWMDERMNKSTNCWLVGLVWFGLGWILFDACFSLFVGALLLWCTQDASPSTLMLKRDRLSPWHIRISCPSALAAGLSHFRCSLRCRLSEQKGTTLALFEG